MTESNAGLDVFFVLVGAILVFAMHGGFAFLELGTVRKKNQVNALVKILVDLRNGHTRTAGVYVIQLGGHLLVKRLNRRVDGGVDVISDNPAYSIEHLGPDAAEALTIIGRVVWAGGKM